MLRGVKDALTAANLAMQVQIYSEGDPADFAQLVQTYDAGLHLNDDVARTWHAFASADILVLSRSSYSYSAALYNTGVVIYTKFWHSKLPSWVQFSDSQQLTKDLQQLPVMTRLKNAADSRTAFPDRACLGEGYHQLAAGQSASTAPASRGAMMCSAIRCRAVWYHVVSPE